VNGRLLSLSLAVLLLALPAGCAHRRDAGRAPATIDAPQAKDLPPPDAIPGTFTVRQKLTARSGHGGGSFEAVLKKEPGLLTLVGLTPFGSRAFLLRQTAAEVQFTSYLPRELPFSPAFMLLDIHRVMDAWLGAPLGSGERAGEVSGERIRERWREGRLIERTFTRVASDPPGEIKIAYSGEGPGGLAALVTLENLRFGYSLKVETLALQ
jgi:hypothetical protein